MEVNLRPASECKFDAVSLGEVMLRLDPGEGRIRTARQFRAWEGGGEYNVVRGLRRCFGLKTAVITAFADNEIELSIALSISFSVGKSEYSNCSSSSGIYLSNSGMRIRLFL